MVTHKIYMILHLVTGFGLRSCTSHALWMQFHWHLCVASHPTVPFKICSNFEVCRPNDNIQWKQIAQQLTCVRACVWFCWFRRWLETSHSSVSVRKDFVQVTTLVLRLGDTWHVINRMWKHFVPASHICIYIYTPVNCARDTSQWCYVASHSKQFFFYSFRGVWGIISHRTSIALAV